MENNTYYQMMNEKYKWINLETGEIYTSLFIAFKNIIKDIKEYKECRTLRMFKLKRINI